MVYARGGLLLSSLVFVALYAAWVQWTQPQWVPATCEELRRSLVSGLPAGKRGGGDGDTISIGADTASAISQYFSVCASAAGNLVLSYNESVNVASSFRWGVDDQSYNLTVQSKHSITVEAGVIITNSGSGTLRLMAGFDGEDVVATVTFADAAKVYSPNEGSVSIYFNPETGSEAHKYRNSYSNSFYYALQGTRTTQMYMWVHDAEDLKNIRYCLYCNYAISRNIDLLGKPIMPIFAKHRQGGDVIPFSGLLDGNNRVISNLKINIPNSNNGIGLFSGCGGSDLFPVAIRDLTIDNASVVGGKLVGIICGRAQFASFDNITLTNIETRGAESGGISGTLIFGNVSKVHITFKKDKVLGDGDNDSMTPSGDGDSTSAEAPQNLIAGVSLRSTIFISSKYKSKRLFGETLPGEKTENHVTFFDDDK